MEHTGRSWWRHGCTYRGALWYVASVLILRRSGSYDRYDSIPLDFCQEQSHDESFVTLITAM